MLSLFEILKILFPGTHGRGRPISFREKNWEEQRLNKKDLPGIDFHNNKITRDNIKYGRRRFGNSDWQYWPDNSRTYSEDLDNIYRLPLELRYFLGIALSKRMLVFYCIGFLYILFFDLAEDENIDDLYNADEMSLERYEVETSNSVVLEGVEEADELDFDFKRNEEIEYNDEIRMDYFSDAEGNDEFSTYEEVLDVEVSNFFYNPIIHNYYKSNETFQSMITIYHDLIVQHGISTNRFIDKRMWSNYFLLMFDTRLSMDLNNQSLIFNWPTNFNNPFVNLEQALNYSKIDLFIDEDINFDTDLNGHALRKQLNSSFAIHLEIHKLIVVLEFICLATLSKKLIRLSSLPKTTKDWQWRWSDTDTL